MNRIYRLVWSRVTNTWVAVSENTRRRGKSGRGRVVGRKAIVAALSLAWAPLAYAGQIVESKQPAISARNLRPCIPPGCQRSTQPVGGQVVSGMASITESGDTTTVRQSSPDLVLNWQSFNIGSQDTVDFLQPSASAIAVNRVLSTNGSQILGHLDANGQVWLINPNGVLFGQGAQVNVGGLVASVLGVSDLNLSSNAISFSGNGTGSVVNQGTINAANGGYVAFLGNHLSNQGTISAKLGTVALGAGSATTLTFNGSRLVKMLVDQSTLNNLAENGALIQADGGTVIMSAGARNALLATVVNNTGVIEARTVASHNGTIELLSGMSAGTVNVGGALDASALDGGNGGAIETSAAHVEVANGAKVTTLAPSGKTGTWLIDPTDFTVALSGGDMTGATLSSDLNSTNFAVLSSNGASQVTGDALGQGGNINVNDTVSWSANTTLTLTAANNVNVNANVTATGNTAGLVINPNTANGSQAASGIGTFNLAMGNSITLSGANPSLSIAGNAYTVINSLGAAGSATGTDLQGINGNLSGYYALGSNIDATATSSWNSGAGFTPIGNPNTPFTGSFNGLGHTVSNLTINLPSTDFVGLFGQVGAYRNPTAVIQNVGLVGASVSGQNGVGGLVGYNYGTVSNSFASYATGNLRGEYVGGLVGYNYGTVSNSYTTGSVSGTEGVGGLVGLNTGEICIISNSYSTANVSGTEYVGGLVGVSAGTISNSYATGNVSAAAGNLGGLVGENNGTISNSYATGNVSDQNYAGVGGLVGVSDGTISNSYATGNVSGTVLVGGLVGVNNGAISNSYATGSVSGTEYVGGLAGSNGGGFFAGTIINSYWNTDNNAAGMPGIGLGTTAGATGLTTAQMQTASNFTGFNFTTTPGASGNNWVIVDTDGTLNNASGTAGATFPLLASEYSTTVSNTHQLQLMAMNTSASYTLGQNVNASATGNGGDVWGSTGFVPIGNTATPFTGTFAGLGHSISNLTINLPSTNAVGLFGYTGSAAVIGNVGLVGGSVIGSNDVGALVGLNTGTVNNTYATGIVSGSVWVGGLVGENGGGTVSNSYATASVSGTNAVGGLVGWNHEGGVSNSYATGSVSGGDGSYYVGGLVGANDATANTISTISNSYATGNVSGGVGVGGLVGLNGYGSVSNSYSTGSVSGTSTVGGLVGYASTGIATVSNSYWDVTTSGQSASAGGTGLNTSQMQTASNFGGLNFTTTPGASGNNWVIVDTDGTLNNAGGAAAATFPMLASEYSTTINNAHQLQLIAMNTAASYTLEQNINASATGSGGDVWGSSGFVPIGAYPSTPFIGTFNGLGNTISNLTINQPFASYVGLFGYAGTGSVIENVGLVVGSVSGVGYVGALVGLNQGSVTNSYATGLVSGNEVVGGLVGENQGTVANSHATGNVSGSGSVGGLVGYNSLGVISNSYATGSVSGTQYVGGLAGNNAGQVSNSYATGNVGGNYYFGGLVGVNTGTGTVSDSYATGSAGGPSEAYYLGGLVGYNYGTVSNSYATGTVIGGSNAGGLVGVNDGTISNSYAAGSVSGTTSVGGLVGLNSGTGAVSNSYATGSVSGASYVGGLVGFANSGGAISNSYATGSVNATGSPVGPLQAFEAAVGGLVGVNNGSVSNSYATGSVSSGTDSYFVGGLVGVNGGTISNSYHTGSVSGSGEPYYVGGVVGLNNATVSNSFWNVSFTGGIPGTGGGPETGTAGLTTAQMQSASSFTGWSIATTGGSGDVWRIFQGNTFPLLISFLTPLTLTDAPDATVTYNGNSQSGATTAISGVLGAAATGRNAGFYNGYYSTQQGYDITGGNLTITPLALTGSIATGSSVYGSALDPGAVTLNGVISGDSVSATAAVNTTGHTSSSGNLNAGSYTGIEYVSALSGADAGNYTIAGAAGNYTVSPLALTGTIATGSSVYGSALNPGAVALSGVITGDLVSTGGVTVNTKGHTSVSGDLNAGSYTGIESVGSALTGADASDYSFAGATGNYAVSPEPLTVTGLSGTNRTYNGSVVDALSGTPVLQGLIGSETLTLANDTNGTLASANVGSQPITTAFTISNGTGKASNYTLIQPTLPNVTIAQLASVAWVGGATGNWSNAANWAGGAIPDYSNVAAVTIPAGDTVTYNSAVPGSTILTTLTNGGNLTMAAGSLSVTGAGTTNGGSFTMSGGNLSVAGNFNTAGFAQSGGTLNVGGGLTAAATSAATLGNITAGSLSVSSTGGAITQTSGTALDVTGTSSLTAYNSSGPTYYNITLSQPGNIFGGTFTATGANVNLADSGAAGLTLGTTTATGSLTLASTAGPITQTGVVSATGASSLTASNGSGTNYNITFANTSNSFGGVITATGQNINLVDDASALKVGNTTATGTLSLDASAGAITQAAGTEISATGATTLTAGTSNITLANTGNDFVGAVSSSGANVSLADSSTSGLTLGNTSVNGALTLTSTAGPITEPGYVRVVDSGTTSLTADNGVSGAGDVKYNISLPSNNNNYVIFGGAVSVNGANVILDGTQPGDAMTVGNITATGTLLLSSQGPITQTAGTTINATGATSLTALSGSTYYPVTLIDSGTGGLILGNTIVGALTLTSQAGPITQASGSGIYASGATSLTAGKGSTSYNIILTNNNDFVGAVASNGLNVSLTEGGVPGGLVLGSTTATGSFSAINNYGPITQAASTAVNATGATSLVTSGSNITLANAANSFGGAVSSSGLNIQLVDGAGGMTLGNTTATGTLIAASSGPITEAASTTLDVTGITTLTTPKTITLANTTNDFGGAVASSGSSIDLQSSGSLILGTTAAGAGGLTIGSAGPISQSAAVNVTGTTSLAAANYNITLANTSNSFGGVITATGQNINLVDDASALKVGNTTATGTLTLTSEAGPITQSASTAIDATGALTLDAQGGAITQGSGAAIVASGTSSLTASNGSGTNYNITLANAGNTFGGAVTATGANVNLSDDAASGLTLGATTASGSLTLASTAGPITQTGQISATGASSLTASNGSGTNYNITLSNTSNSFGGTVTATGQNIYLADDTSTGLKMGATSATGTLTLDALLGAITQSGAITATGTSSLTAASAADYNITLTNAGNSFGGTVTATGNAISITDATVLTAALNGTGNASLTSAGAMNVSGTVAGNLTTDATGTSSTTTFGDTTVGGTGGTSKLTVTSTGAVTTATGDVLTVDAAGTTTSNSHVTVNGVKGAIIP